MNRYRRFNTGILKQKSSLHYAERIYKIAQRPIDLKRFSGFLQQVLVHPLLPELQLPYQRIHA
jgi:hypothetical protein